jgi:TonB family protein
MKNVEIVVGIVLDRMGRVLSTNIITGSGDTSFDDAALAMMRRRIPSPHHHPWSPTKGCASTCRSFSTCRRRARRNADPGQDHYPSAVVMTEPKLPRP